MSDDKKTKDDAKKKIASSLSGAIDPEIRVAGEQFGAWLASVIPSDNWLRSKGAERVFGILRQWAEANVEKLGPIGSAVGEKLTDLLDHASGEIFGLGTEKHSGEKPASMFEKAVDGWTKDFFKDAGERLEKAKPDELDELKKRLGKEFEIRKALLAMMKKEFEKPEAKEEAKNESTVDWAAKLEKFNAEWTTSLVDWKRSLNERREKLKSVRETMETGGRVVFTRGPEIAVILPPARRENPIIKVLGWPVRFTLKLFLGGFAK